MREYEIYQLNAGGRDHMFLNMKELRAMRVTPNIASYDAVYKGTLEPGMTWTKANSLWRICPRQSRGWRRLKSKI